MAHYLYAIFYETNGIPTGTKYDLRKNNDNDWFTVTNATYGTSGTTITKGLHDLQNTAANVLTGQPAVGKGAFLVKLEDGLSLPISVYVTEGSYNVRRNVCAQV